MAGSARLEDHAMSSLDRRTFLAAAGAALALGPDPGRASVPSATGSRALRLGAPVWVEEDDPEALARAHRARGYRAAYCPSIPLDDRERIRATAEAFARQDVVVAEVGRWVNLLDADPVTRRQNLALVTEGLALAEAVGARCCVDIAGSFSTTSWFGPHPDNLTSRFFDAAVENARAIIDAVRPRRARFCYEMMGWSLPDSAEAVLEMRKAVDRAAFAVHLDPCNLVNSPRHYYRSSALLEECYGKLGGLIASVHAKDLTWDVETSLHFREVRPGLGSLDYGEWLSCHVRYAPETPLMLEHLPSQQEYDAARDHIREKAERVGVRLE
jgi:sugar phosphate isomerase/epimerase